MHLFVPEHPPPPKKLKDFEVLEIIYYSFGIPHTSFIQLDDIVSVELGTESECIDFDHEERKHFSPKNRHYAFTIALPEAHRIAAQCIAGGLRPTYGYMHSKWNPSDVPSRPK